MGDLDEDTRVERVGPGRYRGSVSADWALWGPVGGYVAAIALRAAGAHSGRPFPASLSCHYLSPARFDVVDIEVECLRTTRNATSLAVRMTQKDTPVLSALVWAVADDIRGPERPLSVPPDVPGPDEVSVDEAEVLLARSQSRTVSSTATGTFWRNLELRTVAATGDHREVGGAEVHSWTKFRARAFFSDPWVDACRELVSIDLAIFPAVARALDGGRYVTLSIDLYAAFHAPPPAEDYLLVAAQSTAAGAGLVSGTAQTWSRDGTLTSSGGSQLICRMLGA